MFGYQAPKQTTGGLPCPKASWDTTTGQSTPTRNEEEKARGQGDQRPGAGRESEWREVQNKDFKRLCLYDFRGLGGTGQTQEQGPDHYTGA